MNDSPRAMIYGANGYTGQLIARLAVERGMRPTLAGRNHEAIAALAGELDCPFLSFSLENAAQIAPHLKDVAAVMHCAGPFSQTARQMMDACITTGTDYLDITGEIDVILAGVARSERAIGAEVALLPAVGFDVVPSDCLAAMLADRLPGASVLQLAFVGGGGLSAGTAKTMFESLPHGGRVRIDGEIRDVPNAWKTMEVPFRSGKVHCMTIPWGDVASAYYSTGIPNIEVYTAASRKQVARVRRFGFLLPLLGFKPIQKLGQSRIGKKVKGPSDDVRLKARSSLWGRVSDDQGKSIAATLETLSGYELTAQTSVAALERTLAREVPRGFSTASQAFGKEFILSFPDTDIVWAEPVAV
ncbi:MAG: saccharopine dehydrogenase [Planctomycetota bacterium]|nr:MAG: saccharopine dehydrogenase [Planctomycetota bacterium]